MKDQRKSEPFVRFALYDGKRLPQDFFECPAAEGEASGSDCWQARRERPFSSGTFPFGCPSTRIRTVNFNESETSETGFRKAGVSAQSGSDRSTESFHFMTRC